jgi:hypothetical protein
MDVTRERRNGMNAVTATYTKLQSGAWGIRSTSSLRVGQSVTVAKRDGSVKTETVAKIVWGSNGVTVAAIGASAPRSYSRSSRYAYGADGTRLGRCSDGRTGGCTRPGCNCGGYDSE